MIPTSTTLFVIAGVVLIAGASFGLITAARTYWRYRGKSLVTCPETRKPAAVRVDAGRAVRNVLEGKHVRIHLDQCSRWPEREHCGQECLSQIENDPELCHASAMAQQWFLGRSCVYCGKPIEKLRWHDHPPALLDADHQTMIWNEISPEHLPEAFEKCAPVCWSCHIAQTFRREHPELVVDRREDPLRMNLYH